MSGPLLQTFELGAQWPSVDPFLFVAHHHDDYPEGDGRLAPNARLDGRQLGQDFSGLNGWSMYHGRSVPGFPQHPHRGFETVTYVRRGYVDHADSLGATARFGQGDTQWMTAGAGIQHAEMFPLVDTDRPNPLELFQIWLNLPAEDKMVDPYFTMLWSHTIATHVVKDADGRRTEVTIIAGPLEGHDAPAPPPNSWAARRDAQVAIWHVSMEAGASWSVPPAGEGVARAIYAFEGSSIDINGVTLAAGNGALVEADRSLSLVAGAGGIELVVLQGRPIGEPVARYGPFVMNTQAEIQEAYSDYQATQFGGWPWSDAAPNHGPVARRFAIHADGQREDIS